MAQYTKRDLLARVPNLPAQQKKRIQDSVIHGFSTSSVMMQNPHVLVNLDSSGGPWNYRYVPDPGVDLRSKNASKRKIMTLDAVKLGFMKSLNLSLKGGEDYPVLVGALSIITGVASAGAGILFTLTSTIISASKTSQPVLARQGDEIWQVEQIGKEGQDLKHVQYFLLVDPYRKSDKNVGSEWIIHEDRRDLSL